MQQLLSFARLDLITIKPYLTWKNLAIVCLLPIFLMWGNQSSPFAIGTIMMMSALYISYPFSVGEQNGIDALYVTLSIAPRTVVYGRYLFAALLNLGTALLAFLLIFISSIVLGTAFSALETGLIILALLLVYSFIQAFQLPIFFRYGHAKARFAAYLPFAVLPLAGVGAASLMRITGLLDKMAEVPLWIERHPALFIGGLVALIFGIQLLSCKLALSFYRKREF